MEKYHVSISGGHSDFFVTNDIEKANKCFEGYKAEAKSSSLYTEVYMDEWKDEEGNDFNTLEYFNNGLES